MSTTEKMIDDLLLKVSELDIQIATIQELKKEKAQYLKIIRVIKNQVNKRSQKGEVPPALALILEPLKEADGPLTPPQIMEKLVERHSVAKAPSMDWLRVALHKLKIRGLVNNANRGLWQYKVSSSIKIDPNEKMLSDPGKYITLTAEKRIK